MQINGPDRCVVRGCSLGEDEGRGGWEEEEEKEERKFLKLLVSDRNLPVLSSLIGLRALKRRRQTVQALQTSDDDNIYFLFPHVVHDDSEYTRVRRNVRNLVSTVVNTR